MRHRQVNKISTVLLATLLAFGIILNNVTLNVKADTSDEQNVTEIEDDETASEVKEIMPEEKEEQKEHIEEESPFKSVSNNTEDELDIVKDTLGMQLMGQYDVALFGGTFLEDAIPVNNEGEWKEAFENASGNLVLNVLAPLVLTETIEISSLIDSVTIISDEVITVGEVGATSLFSISGGTHTFNLQGIVFDGQGENVQNRLFKISDNATVTINAEGATFKGFYLYTPGSGQHYANSGGVIHVVASGFTLNGGIFSENHVSYRGGAIHAENSGVTVSNASFENNIATNAGGAIRSAVSDVTLIETSFIGNTAKDRDDFSLSSFGGALSSTDDDLIITDCLFENNSVNEEDVNGTRDAYGGAIYISRTFIPDEPDTKIEGTSFVRNKAKAGNGGAIYQDQGHININSSVFSQNTAAAFGGAIHTINGYVDIFNTHFEGNKTKTDGGGGISLDSRAYATIASSEFLRNKAGVELTEPSYLASGGAIYASGSDEADVVSLIVKDTTFNQNHAHANGGAISVGEIYNSGVNLELSGTNSFTDNYAKMNGGALSILLSNTISIEGLNEFKGNKALGEFDNKGNGGAIYITSSLSMLGDNSFVDNTATTHGGAIFQGNGLLKCNDGFLFDNNKADIGGAISSGGKITANQGIFKNNKATSYGGAIYSEKVYAKTSVFYQSGSYQNGFDLLLGEGVVFEDNEAASEWAFHTIHPAHVGAYEEVVKTTKFSNDPEGEMFPYAFNNFDVAYNELGFEYTTEKNTFEFEGAIVTIDDEFFNEMTEADYFDSSNFFGKGKEGTLIDISDNMDFYLDVDIGLTWDEIWDLPDEEYYEVLDLMDEIADKFLNEYFPTIFIGFEIDGDPENIMQPGEGKTFDGKNHIAKAIFRDAPEVLYRVTYTSNGGEGVEPAAKEYSAGETLTVEKNKFKKEGYRFIGWQVGEDFYQPGQVITIEKDMNFVAQWVEEDLFNVTYLSGGGTGTVPESKEYQKNVLVTVETNPFTREGYRFVGWAANGTVYEPGDVFQINKDMVFVAQWVLEEDNEYTGGGGSGGTGGGSTIMPGSTPSTPDSNVIAPEVINQLPIIDVAPDNIPEGQEIIEQDGKSILLSENGTPLGVIESEEMVEVSGISKLNPQTGEISKNDLLVISLATAFVLLTLIIYRRKEASL